MKQQSWIETKGKKEDTKQRRAIRRFTFIARCGWGWGWGWGNVCSPTFGAKIVCMTACQCWQWLVAPSRLLCTVDGRLAEWRTGCLVVSLTDGLTDILSAKCAFNLMHLVSMKQFPKHLIKTETLNNSSPFLHTHTHTRTLNSLFTLFSIAWPSLFYLLKCTFLLFLWLLNAVIVHLFLVEKRTVFELNPVSPSNQIIHKMI